MRVQSVERCSRTRLRDKDEDQADHSGYLVLLLTLVSRLDHHVDLSDSSFSLSQFFLLIEQVSDLAGRLMIIHCKNDQSAIVDEHHKGVQVHELIEVVWLTVGPHREDRVQPEDVQDVFND